MRIADVSTKLGAIRRRRVGRLAGRRVAGTFGRLAAAALVAGSTGTALTAALDDDLRDDEWAPRITWRDPNERRQSTAQLIQP